MPPHPKSPDVGANMSFAPPPNVDRWTFRSQEMWFLGVAKWNFLAPPARITIMHHGYVTKPVKSLIQLGNYIHWRIQGAGGWGQWGHAQKGGAACLLALLPNGRPLDVADRKKVIVMLCKAKIFARLRRETQHIIFTKPIFILLGVRHCPLTNPSRLAIRSYLVKH